MLFDQLKEGLAGPLSGMGIAFSSSLFGLAGSLILGFLDLQAGHAQSRFYNELEDWLANVTELQTTDPGDSVPPQLRYALMDMQRSISDLGERVGQGAGGYGSRHPRPVPRCRQAHPANARRAEGGARMGRRTGPAAAGDRHRAAPGRFKAQGIRPEDECDRGSDRWVSRAAAAANYQTNLWPGFVDMLSTLLLVVIFLMSLFMVTNYIITQASQAARTQC